MQIEMHNPIITFSVLSKPQGICDIITAKPLQIFH